MVAARVGLEAEGAQPELLRWEAEGVAVILAVVALHIFVMLSLHLTAEVVVVFVRLPAYVLLATTLALDM